MVNKRKLSFAKCSVIKRPFNHEKIRRVRIRLEIANDLMQLALLTLWATYELLILPFIY